MGMSVVMGVSVIEIDCNVNNEYFPGFFRHQLRVELGASQRDRNSQGVL
jgi:hypothetical protein